MCAAALLLLPAAALAACDTRGGAQIDFSGARLVRSNLGGLGGRCAEPDECAETQTATTPRELYFSNVLSLVDPLASTFTARTDAVDLRVTNQSEYRAWSAQPRARVHPTDR